MELKFYNYTSQKIDLEKLKGIENLFAKIDGKVEISFIGKTRMQKFNRLYRKKNQPTDVLSFNYTDDKKIVGEILIFPKYKKETFGEIDKLVIHGILHLLGYDHEKTEKEADEMERIQDEFLHKFRQLSI